MLTVSLISQVLHCGDNVNLADTTEKPCAEHVDSAVDSGTARSVPGVDEDGGGTATVRLVDFATEFEDALGTGWGGIFVPGEVVELGDGASLAALQVLEVERTDQVVVGPDVLGHQVDLEGSVHLASRVRPVVLLLFALIGGGEIHDEANAVLPDCLPEGCDLVAGRGLGGDVDGLSGKKISKSGHI